MPALMLAILAPPAFAEPTYLLGTIDDISSDAAGIVFRFNSRALPGNCTGSIGSFFRIDAADQAMASVLMSFFVSGKRSAVVFTSGLNASGYCHVVAFDPVE